MKKRLIKIPYVKNMEKFTTFISFCYEHISDCNSMKEINNKWLKFNNSMEKAVENIIKKDEEMLFKPKKKKTRRYTRNYCFVCKNFSYGGSPEETVYCCHCGSKLKHIIIEEGETSDKAIGVDKTIKEIDYRQNYTWEKFWQYASKKLKGKYINNSKKQIIYGQWTFTRIKRSQKGYIHNLCLSCDLDGFVGFYTPYEMYEFFNLLHETNQQSRNWDRE